MCRAWLPSPALGGGRRGRNDEEKHRYKQVCFLSPKPQNLKVAKSLGGTMAKSEQQGTPWANTLAILSVSLSLFFFFFLLVLDLNSGVCPLAKQALYHLSHTCSLFYSGYFGDGVL
jgi:hypothetical protein